MKNKIEKITDKLTLYFRYNYPVCINKIDSKIFTVFLGVGGNIGNTIKRFDSLLKIFKNDTRIKIMKTSPILKNPPFGYLEQEYFYNAVIKISTSMPPLYLLNIMQKYEQKFGRKRSFKDAPRTLDIDIILIQKNGRDLKINHKNLVVPHIGWQIRPSVKIPLSYMQKIR